jgi:type IV pilus assembly protein PilQ
MPKVDRKVWSLAVAASLAALLGGTPPAAAGRRGDNLVSAVDGREQGGVTTIRIEGSATPTFTAYELERPARVVIDLAGASVGDALGSEGVVTRRLNGWAVSQLSTSAVGEGDGRLVRVVALLARDASYTVAAEGHDVVVKITSRERPKATPAGAASAAELSAAKADVARARAAAESASAEADRVKRDAAADAARARAAADAAAADAARVKREAAALAEQARREVAAAKAEAERARREAAGEKAAAAARLSQADRMIADAGKKLATAEASRSAAAQATARAEKRERAASEAAARAAEERALAQRAAADAARARAEADRAAQKNDGRAATLRADAESATRAALARQQKAEAAAREAESRKAEAERIAREADAARSKATEVLAAAETERKSAEQRRADAERARRAAEQQAEAARRRAAASSKAVAEAERRLSQLATLRAREESMLGKAETARQAAELRREAAEQAASSLENTQARLARVEAAAASAKQADKRRLDDEVDAQRQAAARQRAEVAKLAAARDRAMSELTAIEAKASTARDQRIAEERRVSALAGRPAAPPAHAMPRLREVEFADRASSARVVLELTGPAVARVVENKGRQAVLEIKGASLDGAAAAALDTRQHGGPIQRIAPSSAAGAVRVAVELGNPTDSVLRRHGNTYFWDFTKAAREPRPSRAFPTAVENSLDDTLDKLDGASARRSGATRATDYASAQIASYGASSTPITQQTVAQMKKTQKVYRGRKIDLDFKDADIHNLLRLLADVGGVNIVVPDSIRASVTVRLRDVPWDQAMEVILQSKGLWYRREGNLVRVADRKDLDAEDREEAERLKVRVESEPPEAEIFTLNYSDAGSMTKKLRPLLSPKGRIEVDDRTNSLIINDIAAHRRRMIDLVSRLDTQTPQIQIEARIVEARSTYIREIGIQWGGNLNASAAGGNSTGLVFPNSVGVGGATGDAPNAGIPSPADFAVNMPAAIGQGSGGGIGMSLGSVGGNVNLALRLSALEDQGTVRIISSPKITTSDHIAASISSGVSIPISVVSANGVSTQFVPADLSLKVTPSVSQRDCAVSMKVAVTKNEADFANTGARGDPTILTKQAQTTILVGDGQTAVIGGIYTRNTGMSFNKVPFLAEIPVLGWLFKTRRENDERAEVLVFITPKITNRAFLRCE